MNIGVTVWMPNWMIESVCVPEEAFAALAGHRIKVKASGFVSTHTTDPRNITVKLIWHLSGCTNG